VKIAPSLLSADFGRLREEIEMLNESEADVFHVDVMDGRFVPNISFGFPILNVLARYARKPLDVHLMIVEPELYADRFIDAGCHWLSFHLEATPHAHRLLNRIREKGVKAGLAVNPQTPTLLCSELLTELDFVNLMSVNPGFGGQSFIEGTYGKIRQLDANRKQLGSAFEIEIDGGVGSANALELKKAGADVLVAGNAVFGSADPKQKISELKWV
jgi:ribulose-phosphate 3-epimerase